MTSERKVHGWLYPNRESEEVYVMTSGEYDERMYSRVKNVLPGGGIPIRIIPASEPTAAEVRQAVIAELLEWCCGQRNVDCDSLSAKLRKLQGEE